MPEKKVSSKEVKEDYLKRRNAEIEGYYSELAAWCKEREIDITATVTLSELGPPEVKIMIINVQ